MTTGTPAAHESCDERELNRLAARQHGVVSRRSLLELGLGRGAINRRVATGRLVPLQRGVYLVAGAPLTREARWMEALLACGPRAALSHRTAGAIWTLVAAPPEHVEVTAPAVRRRPGIDVHRSTLRPDEQTTWRGLAITTPSRTLLDLAARFTPSHILRAVEEAEVRRILNVAAIERLLEHHPGRPGTRALRVAMEQRGLIGEGVVRSVFESAFAGFLATAGLPAPRLNARVAAGSKRIEVDVAWFPQRVAVELDGHETHGTRSSFERDRARDRALHVAGWRVVRITWRQFHQERGAIARDLRALLAGDRPADGPRGRHAID